MFVVLKRKEIIKVLIVVIVFVSCVVCLSFADVDRTVFAKSNRKLPVYRVDNGEDKTNTMIMINALTICFLFNTTNICYLGYDTVF